MRSRFAHVALALVVFAGFRQIPAGPNHVQEILARARAAIGDEARLQAVRSLSVRAIVPVGGIIYPGGFAHLHIDFLLPDRFLVSTEQAYLTLVDGYSSKGLIERRELSGQWTDARPADRSSDAYRLRLAARRRECARYLVAWLLTAPAEYGVEFVEATEPDKTVTKAESTGEKAPKAPNADVKPEPKKSELDADAVDVRGADGLALRLYFDKRTHRLVKLTYREPAPYGSSITPPASSPRAGEPGAPIFRSLEDPEGRTDQVTMEFAEHYPDDGLVFPHKVRIEVGGLHEEWEISRFQVNPTLDPKQFIQK